LIWRISSVASQRAFAACFDASLALIGAHEAEGEASDDGHVFGPVSGPIAGQVVAELDIEQPVHALHPPMSAYGAGHPLDVEGRR
jgi:hypothetical protein